MLVASLVRKTLWLLRYPSFSQQLVGPYQDIGALQTRIPSGGVVCQIHYPCQQPQEKSSSFVPYFRPQAIQGLADYSRTPSIWLDFLAHRSHPCRMNAKPLVDNKDHQFPIVVFSHGLGGCMEMYTQLCQQVASYGYIVIAMEHEDGSGCYAEQQEPQPTTSTTSTTTTTIKDSKVILYQRPDDTPYSRQKVVTFRRAFLQQRLEETRHVMDYVTSSIMAKNDEDVVVVVEEEDNSPSTNLLEKILQTGTVSKGISLMGHSFGGASMILTAQQFQQTPNAKDDKSSSNHNNNNNNKIASVSVLDPWAFSLDDDVLERGLSSSIPTLSILSESWLTNPETAFVDKLLSNCGNNENNNIDPSWYYAPNSVHASFADSVSWLPGWILRKLYLRGAKEGRHDTIRAVANACHVHMQQGFHKTGGGSSGRRRWEDANLKIPLKKYSFQKQETRRVEKMPVTAS